MSFEVDVGHASARGPRERNEDFAGALRAAPHEAARGLVAAVADGVSAGGQGLEAAQTSVMGLLADFFAVPPTWETTAALDRLIGAQSAWLAAHNRRRSGPGEAGAALTTLTALVLQGQTWTLAHVGDTRAWLWRAGELLPLSQDHAFDHPDQRSRLTRAIGLDDTVRVDYAQGDARPGDVFVLTSDGVHGALRPARIAALLAALQAAPAGAGGSEDEGGGEAGDRAAAAVAQALVDAALAAGGRDNATALVLRVRGLDARQLADEQADGRRLPVPPRLAAGDALDGLTITRLVADTGIHLLYQASPPGGGAPLLVKTLHPARTSDPQERAMLAHEGWLGQRVAGTGFVRVHPRPPGASAFYLVFDWHPGRSMAQRLDSGERPEVAEVVQAGIATARALARLHRQGVVHRDIKPGNLHRGDDGVWRLLDLGVAVSGREPAAQRELHAGTPSYMNPEQWDGAQAHAGSDLFALGATLYQWLTGRLPYGEIEPYARGRHRRDPPPPSRLRPDVPMWLDHLLRKAVARDAAQRFETAEELLLALERGASRPLPAPGDTPLLRRDPRAALQLALGLSLLLNALLLVWLAFLPR